MELYSFSRKEAEGLTFPNELDFSLPCLLARQSLVPKNDILQVFEHIWRGGMPDAQKANPDWREVKKYELLDRANLKRGSGGIVCMCEETVPIDAQNCLIPCNLI